MREFILVVENEVEDEEAEQVLSELEDLLRQKGYEIYSADQEEV